MNESKVEFYNDKNQKIAGLLSLSDKKKSPIVIIIHGFKGTKEYYPFVDHSVPVFLDAGIAVLRIDCRGSGESDMEFKEMTIESEAEDVLMAVEYVKSRGDIDSERVALIGISMGASAILTAMKKKPKVRGLIFWGPAFFGNNYFETPENRKTVEEEGVWYVEQRFTGKKLTAGKELFYEMIGLDTSPYMKLVKAPVLILRGSKDEVVDSKRDKEAAKLLNADYKIIENGDHNFTDPDSEKSLIKITADWCKRIL